MITGKYPSLRLRRNRKNSWSRRLVSENNLSPNDFILPVFLIEGKNKTQPIKSMPGVYRYSINKLGIILDRAIKNQIPMVALFPYTPNNKKDDKGSEALNPNNFICSILFLPSLINIGKTKSLFEILFSETRFLSHLDFLNLLSLVLG